MRIQPTHIEFRNLHTPVSTLFDDVYFVAEQGIEECTYVYLEGTDFINRVKTKASHLQLAEVGFGVGLNFLVTLREFKANAEPNQRLTFFSCERYPVYEADLRELYSRYPELAEFSSELLEQYPVLTPGFHTLSFLNGRVKLVLMLGDAHEMLSRLDAQIDLWYWDGFTPSKNPEAFSAPLFQQVARLSAVGARGASFTAAGWVRRELETLGFKIEKRLGFFNKRECIYGIKTEAAPQPKPILAPWFSNQNLTLLKPGDRIAVAGAGLSGSAIARALADRGFAVTVFDPNGVANRASGNSVGLFNIQLSKLPNPISRFSQLALTHFLRELKKREIATRLGIFRIDETAQTSLETSNYPEDFFSKTVEDGKDGFYFPKCGILNPPALCESRLAHPRIELKKEAATAENLKAYDHVVYALGADLVLPDQKLDHEELKRLPLRPIRGQTIEVMPTEASKEMTMTWVKEGYISPIAPEVTGHQLHLIGATYQAKNIEPDQEERDNQKLVSDACREWNAFESLSLDSIIRHRSGYRLSTPDKLPMIGPVSNTDAIRVDYARAFKGSPTELLPPLTVHAKEWMMLGMGSRGITFSSLSAELLASMMVGDPLPIEMDLWEHLHSARFSIRNLKRNELP